ncbi:hypothetical protein [Stenotrophomonas sp.]|uniref:hypothetical protein n=1 Tax=Stenotrophomonas sp. TaxID=69392 RepID=UPI0028A9BACB|nr:hypothetical protein [Stenotrophomonas sp.]
MIDVNVADAVYCAPLNLICQPIEWWSSAASWAQAILSAAAIYFAAMAASAPERLSKQRKAASYLALLDIAERVLGLSARVKPSPMHSSQVRQIAGQFAQVNVENVPDYRFLIPMQETFGTLTTLADLLDARFTETNALNQEVSDELIKQMAETYSAQLRGRRENIAQLVKEIAPTNMLTRLANAIRRTK